MKKLLELRGLYIWCIFLILVSICESGFFSSLLGGDTNVQGKNKYEPSKFRGVPDHLDGNYEIAAFVCDNGDKVIANSSINDGYCDCRDSSDEPGTSACSHSAYFSCVNRGFKIIRIPSSRVDDGICDCCDGSDEGTRIYCSNTCADIAERERIQSEQVNKCNILSIIYLAKYIRLE
jgi:hypothetical protein